MKLGATVTSEKYRTTYKPFLLLKSPYDPTEASLNQVRTIPKGQSQMFNIDGNCCSCSIYKLFVGPKNK